MGSSKVDICFAASRRGGAIALIAFSCLLSLSLAMVCRAAPAGAFSEHVLKGTVGEPCSAAPCAPGSLAEPSGVAVNESSGEVYVVDRAENRVERFDSAGAFLSQFDGSATPSGSFSSPTAIAVDDSSDPLDPSAGDVYVLDSGNKAIDKFDSSGGYLGQVTAAGGTPFEELDGVAVDPSGQLWVSQSSNEIDSFTDAMANEFISSRGAGYGLGAGLAVDSEHNLYINRAIEEVAKISEAGNSLFEGFDPERTTAVAVDPTTNDVYIDNVETIAQFSGAGTLIERFGAGHLTNSDGLTIDGAASTVYASDAAAKIVDRFVTVVLPDVATGTGAGDGSSATITGTVKPDGVPVTSCEFEYGTTSGYGSTVPCSQTPGEIGTGNAPVPVSASIAGLSPGTAYHFRLVAANENGQRHGEDEAVTTPPWIEAEFVGGASDTNAKLAASISPGGLPTSYRFEYGTSASYGAVLPVGEGPVGSGYADMTVTVQPQNLSPSATYHYRVVAVNRLGTIEGEDRTFSTQPAAAPFALPDHRGWELVSPPDKHGGLVQPLLIEGAAQAASDGEAFTFLSIQSLFAEPSSAPVFAQALARRTPAGWTSEDISIPRDAPTGQSIGSGLEYRLFSPDLSVAAVQPWGRFTPLSPQATERTPYLRDNATGTYTPLLTPTDVTSGAKFGGHPEYPNESDDPVRFISATPDFKHILMQNAGQMPPLTSSSTEGGLYEWSSGALKLVNVLPNNIESSSYAFLGYGDKLTTNAVSGDGSRVFWEGLEPGGSERHLYLRDTVRERTLQIDTVQFGPGAGYPNPTFQAATPDGSAVFFTDEQQLTQGSVAEVRKPDLYECEVIEAGGALSCRLKDLTPAPAPGESAEVSGFVAGLGETEDSKHLYFLAHGVLTATPNESGEHATTGGNNLYVLSEEEGTWKPTFIAGLTAADSYGFISPEYMTARVSPNGRYLAFMSARGLTGYDNRDVNSGQPDEEVFMYDAQAAPQLRCVSCNPTGARPDGSVEEQGGTTMDLVDHVNRTWVNTWVAANIPTWEDLSVGELNYQPRYLSNQGRLFFNTSDALVPQDVNDQWDVYEYEPASVGTCTGQSETFNAKTSGCVNLISSGTSSQESAFLDASESGGDVFFITQARLTPEDTDERLDVYDAHECSLSPCIAPKAPAGASLCTATATCRPAGSEQPSLSSFPSSLLTGYGNVNGGKIVAKSKPRAGNVVRAKKLVQALKACRRRPARTRARCRAIAFKRYGAKTARYGSSKKAGR
jgi:hypothetical protein